MATQVEDPHPAVKAQLIANTFVEQYYEKLLAQPEVVYKFYEDQSTIGRPDEDGEMSLTTTMLGIKDKIMSSGYHRYKVEIVTVDAQASFKEGLLLLVTGIMTGEDETKRSFMQTFFLAEHATGYYVLNDIFRFVKISEAATTSVDQVTENGVTTPLTENHGFAQVTDHQANIKQSTMEMVKSNGEFCDAADKKGLIDDQGPMLKEVAITNQPSCPIQNEKQEPPKISYASMLAKETPVTSPIKRPHPVVIVGPSSKTSNTQPEKSSTPAPQRASSPHHKKNAPSNNNDKLTEVKGIYVGNLPSNISLDEVDATFKQFGPIRKDGIQIRHYEDGFCYGFVEFESPDAALKAIQAHTFWFGTYKAYVTAKKSSNQAAGKGEVRNDYSRSRESSVQGRRDGRSHNGNRGSGRNHDEPPGQNRWGNRNHNGFSGQNRGHDGSGEQQRVYQDRSSRPAAPRSS